MIMGEVDKSRKEIQTLKKLNEDLEKDLQEWKKRSKQQLIDKKELQAKMTAKTA